MFFKRKILLTTLAKELSEPVAAGTIHSIQESMRVGTEEDSGDAFYAHFFGQLAAWSVTAFSATDDTTKQIAFAISDQLPFRYAEMGVIEGCPEEDIRSEAEKCMREIVARAKEKKSDLGTALGFWVASKLNADPMRAMTLPLEYIECLTANARLVNTMKRKCKITYDVQY